MGVPHLKKTKKKKKFLGRVLYISSSKWVLCDYSSCWLLIFGIAIMPFLFNGLLLNRFNLPMVNLVFNLNGQKVHFNYASFLEEYSPTELRWPNEYDQNLWIWPKSSHRRTLTWWTWSKNITVHHCENVVWNKKGVGDARLLKHGYLM